MRGFFVLLIFSLLLSSCTSEPVQKLEKQGGKKGLFSLGEKTISVTAYVVGSREVPLVIHETGKTEAVDRFEVKASSVGTIQKIYVEEGAQVNPGDPLIKFNDELTKLRLAKAQAEAHEAEAGLENVRYLQQNKDALVADGKMSQVEAEGLDERTNLYQAILERAKVETTLYERTGEMEQVNSPIAGTAVRHQVSEGSSVSADQLLLEVVRLDPIRFVFTVSEDSMAALSNAKEVAIRFPAFLGQEFHGEVVSVGSEVKGGGVEAKIQIANPDRVLKTELSGEVTIQTELKKKILPIPEASIVHGDRTDYVFKIEGTQAKKTAIELGEAFNGQPTVRKGIREGEMIAASVEDLKDGMTVEVKSNEK